MRTYIALLKGINVGGHKKVPMADLREQLTKSGLVKVRTYIQSGNVVFECDDTDLVQMEARIQDVIKSYFGFEVAVLVRTRGQLKRIFDNSPFSEEKKQKSYFAMLHGAPDSTLVEVASEKVYEGEEYQIINDCIYFYCAMGYGRAKFDINFFERKLKTKITARNYNTMIKLLAMSSENKDDR